MLVPIVMPSCILGAQTDAAGAATISRGRTPTATYTSSSSTSRSMSLSATHRRAISESPNVKAGGTEAAGVVGMGEIEEEERRLREKASKLEVGVCVEYDDEKDGR